MAQKGCKKHLSGPLAARVGMCAGDSYQEYSNPFAGDKGPCSNISAGLHSRR
ncbi:hypothetical protein BURK2_02869 [Burkholderiales bacterium]|nr:hypothetical protein BURK2_02869 [Burkholderiales bacterium]